MILPSQKKSENHDLTDTNKKQKQKQEHLKNKICLHKYPSRKQWPSSKSDEDFSVLRSQKEM